VYDLARDRHQSSSTAGSTTASICARVTAPGRSRATRPSSTETTVLYVNHREQDRVPGIDNHLTLGANTPE